METIKGKTTNGLMRHLRDEHGISISGSKSKKDLLNMGYYHGYKGYRFIGNSQNKIAYTKFDEVVAVYQFDANLKSILYPNIMLFETAIKNYTLDTIIGIGPADFESAFSQLLNDYKKHPVGNSDYRAKMKKRLELRDKVNGAISYNYSDNKAVIQHFFHNNKQVPLWAIFEVISLGEFGFFIQCLNEKTRIAIAEDLRIHSTSHNQNGRILEDIIFLIKDLRNAVAHNSVVFDCRFRKMNPPSRLKEYIQSETGISNITFVNIVDFFVVLIFLLKKLGIPKTELRKLLKNFSSESEGLRKAIPVSVHTSIMGSDLRRKIDRLMSYI
ncbi:Abi family protein [Paenibacillus odorifer]|uniref:Abi family protein n=1 Tax=Paenibacillus odorifer TaxID=189426 RepID=UPI001483603B|nr:Abi family protein [Paenibacillus odorifer]